MSWLTVTVNQDMKALVLALPHSAEFVLRVAQAARRRVLAMVQHSSHGTCRLEAKRVEMLPVPLPPKAEQARICRKLDQLLALCDDLEAKLRARDERAAKLAEALVAQVVAGRKDLELALSEHPAAAMTRTP
jgi:type I restriction enzyme S subunit